MPYFFLKTVFKINTIAVKPLNKNIIEENFNGSRNIRRRPVIDGQSSVLDYHHFSYDHIMKSLNDPMNAYYSYGALRYWLSQGLDLIWGYKRDGTPIKATRGTTHESLILPLHTMYFNRVSCPIIQFECNRLRENVVKMSLEDGEGFWNGSELVGFSDAINIGLEGEAPSWVGYASKGVIAMAIFAVFETKANLRKDKRRMKWAYRILKSRNLVSCLWPFISHNHKMSDLIALKASYEVLLDYDNNVFYRVGYRNVLRILEEGVCHQCSSVELDIEGCKRSLRLQL